MKIGVQASRVGIDDRIVQAGNALVRLHVGPVREDPFDAGGVVHRHVETSDGAIAPPYHCHFGYLEVVE